MNLLIITGMSGAGKSSVSRMLEDQGYFCVDNLPITLIPTFMQLTLDSTEQIEKVALGLDVRSGPAISEVAGMLDERFQIVLIGLNPSQIASLPKGILGLPRTDNLEQLVQAYSAADLFLNPSAEETFGMTTLEARYCGTEAVVYRETLPDKPAALRRELAIKRLDRSAKLRLIEGDEAEPSTDVAGG